MIGIFIYNIVLTIVLLVMIPAFALQYRGKRKGSISSRLGISLPDVKRGGLLVHALSVGEVLSVIPLLSELKKTYPERLVYLSVSTTTGFQTAQKQIIEAGLAQKVFYAPVDFLPVVSRYLKAIMPSEVIIVETDIWPNFLNLCRLKSIPTAFVNFRISPSRHRLHKTLKPFFCNLYNRLAAITFPYEQDFVRYNILENPKSPQLLITGALKYDREKPEELKREHFGLKADSLVIVAGSTHPREEKIILDAWQKLSTTIPDLFLIIAPRDKPRFSKVAEIVKSYNITPGLLTEDARLTPEKPVLIVDELGHLASIYGLADAAFVGGSLVDFGGHNPFEPMVWGVPVIFGPYMKDFQSEAETLIAGKAAIRAVNVETLTEAFRNLLVDKDYAKETAAAAQKIYAANSGAAIATLDFLKEIFRW